VRVKGRGILFTFLSFGVLCVVSILSLFVGPYDISFHDILRGVVSFVTSAGDGSTAVKVVSELRMPRLILSVIAGGSLSVCGAIFQTVLGNPLADPYILGVSGGAAVGAVLYFFLPGALGGGILLSLMAFTGATLTSFGVYILSGVSGKRSRGRLILTGVIVGAFMNAIILLLIALTPPGKIPGAIFWLMGDLSGGTGHNLLLLLPIVMVSIISLYLMSRGLDVMLLGDEASIQSGIEIEKFKALIFLVVSFLTGAIVSVSGLIGFVGLIIPHMVRGFTGSLHSKVIPGCFLLGASFLVLSDLISRGVMSGGTLPVGAVTAIFGAPFFIYILRGRL
jgi:iron complex transport system permease protein